MKTPIALLITTILFFSNPACCQEIVDKKDINQSWLFTPGYAYNMQKQPPWQEVDLPHSWNAMDANDGNIAYYRGLGVYKKQLNIKEKPESKRYYLKFEGSTTVTDVFVNGQHVGHHKGGYTAFTFEVTEAVKAGDNELLVMVNNAYDSEVMPLVGDFNVYGGIHRPVHLIIKDEVSFEMGNHGSSGIFISQKQVSKETATIEVKGKIFNGSAKDQEISMVIEVLDAKNKVVAQKETKLQSSKTEKTEFVQNLEIANPTLWNGKENPYLYYVKIAIKSEGIIVDQITQPLGLRNFKLDPDKGFFLNGKYLDLKGVCYHEAKQGKGSALTKADYKEDFQIMIDMGVNAIRTAHYPHSETFYDMCDSLGIVVYTEIPQVGPGGFIGRGFINSQGFKDNGKQQLTELIRQNYNHPSIVFWGLYNELKIQGDDPHEYITELNQLAKKEDPYRYTMAATFQDNHNNDITDAIGFNKYYGWYGGNASEIGTWADEVHQEFPNRPVSVSEYGAGASIQHHSDSLVAPKPAGMWHPEEWQANYHEENWKALKTRPFIWGKFIWLMFDFGAAHRSEGDTKGINDKGIVSANREVKKDAYYFYKANWNPEPMLQLAEKRYVERINPNVKIKAYTNLPVVDFYLNGKKIGSAKSSNGIALSKEIALKAGDNTITIKGKKLQDQVVWTLVR